MTVIAAGWDPRARGSLRLLLRQEPCRQQRHGPPGCPLFLSFLPRNARDVEMRPIEFPGEPRQEARCRNAAARAAAHIGEIREVAIEPFLVVVPERELPAAVVGVVTGAYQTPRK